MNKTRRLQTGGFFICRRITKLLKNERLLCYTVCVQLTLTSAICSYEQGRAIAPGRGGLKMNQIQFATAAVALMLISEIIMSFTVNGGKSSISNIRYGESRIGTARRWILRSVFILSGIYLIIKAFVAVVTNDILPALIYVGMLGAAFLLMKLCEKLSRKVRRKRDYEYHEKYINELDQKMAKKYSRNPIVDAAAKRFESNGSFRELRVYGNAIAFYKEASPIPRFVEFRSEEFATSKAASKEIVKAMGNRWEKQNSIVSQVYGGADEVLSYIDFGYEEASQEVRYGITVSLAQRLNLPHGFCLAGFEHRYKYESSEFWSKLEINAYGIVHTIPNKAYGEYDNTTPELKKW